MTDANKDAWLDNRLRDVPVPGGMLARLRDVRNWDDQHVDTALSEVPIPAGFRDRLRSATEEMAIDDALRDVAVPMHLLRSLRSVRRARAWRWHRGWTAAAVAATLLLALTATMWRSAQTGRGGSSAVTLLDGTSSVDSVHPAMTTTATDRSSVASSPADGGAEPRTGSARSQVASETDTGVSDDNSSTVSVTGLDATNGLGSPVGDSTAWHGSLDLVAGLIPRGIELPLSPGYDRAFLWQSNSQPLVRLAAARELATIELPVWSRTASYENTFASLVRDVSPDTAAIHVEDFVATMQYGFPPGRGGPVSLSVTAGESPFAGSGRCVLQWTVEARRGTPAAGRHKRLFILIDEQFTQADAALQRHMAATALHRLSAQMGSNDRCWLRILRSEQAELLADADANAMAKIADWWQFLDARQQTVGTESSGTDRALLWQEAVTWMSIGSAATDTAAMAPRADIASTVLLLTDTSHGAGVTAAAPDWTQLADELTEAATVHVLDLGGTASLPVEQFPDTAQERQPSPDRVAYTTINSADELVGNMATAIADGQADVADQVRLQISFNPQVVAAYRLVGHEPELTGWLPAAKVATLKAGQVATSLVEVELIGGAADATVATGTLTWRDSQNGRQLHAQARVLVAQTQGMGQPELRWAVAAAEAADALRDPGPVVKTRKRITSVLAHCGALAGQPDRPECWESFLQLLESAGNRQR